MSESAVVVSLVELEPRLRHSKELGALVKSLAAAQKNFPAVRKNQTADVDGTSKTGAKVRYSYTYADLADIIDACRPHLAAEGIAILQPLIFEDGQHWLVTRLHHESDQWIESVWPLRSHDRPQDFGSEMTYARRYTLQALVGIAAEEDDDAKGAQGPSSKKGSQDMPACPQCHLNRKVINSKFREGRLYCLECKVEWAPEGDEPRGDDAPPPPPDAPTIDETQRKRLTAMATELKIPGAEYRAIVRRVAGVDTSMLIPADKFDDVMKAVTAAGMSK
jgi:hypothetical protein